MTPYENALGNSWKEKLWFNRKEPQAEKRSMVGQPATVTGWGWGEEDEAKDTLWKRARE